MQTEMSQLKAPHVLIVENDENDAIILTRVLERIGIDLNREWVSSMEEFVTHLLSSTVDLVICDYHLQPETALDVLEKIGELKPELPLIVVSHQIGERAAVEVMKAGARDVVNKLDYKHLMASVAKELIVLDRVRERERLTTKLYDVDRERRDLQLALQKVKEAEAEANSLLGQLNKVFESSPDGIRVIDRDCNVLRVNGKYLKFTAGDARTSLAGKCFEYTPRAWCHSPGCLLKRAVAGETKIEESIKVKGDNGVERQFVLSVAALFDANGEVDGIVENLKDVTQWQQMQRQVLHAQKMESIGQLAAGIAHEINTPTQFVGDNISFLKESFQDLLDLIQTYGEVFEQFREGKSIDELSTKLEEARETADLEYLTEEIPQAIAQSEEGTTRISSIVRAMKEFSHPGSDEPELFNVNQNIQNTVTVARNEWKYVSRVNMEFGFNLPMVRGYPGEFNQTILNMIVNAAHAIEAKSADKPEWKGTISVKTSVRDGYVVVVIEDNGKGIPKEILDRIYDPFFTTKGVGKGTGQGLAIAHSSIVDKHNGQIEVSSVEGEGTTFTISLPSVALEDSKES